MIFVDDIINGRFSPFWPGSPSPGPQPQKPDFWHCSSWPKKQHLGKKNKNIFLELVVQMDNIYFTWKINFITQLTIGCTEAVSVAECFCKVIVSPTLSFVPGLVRTFGPDERLIMVPVQIRNQYDIDINF